MKTSNNLQILFTLLSSRVHLGAHSSKKAVQAMNLVVKILDQINERRRVGPQLAKVCKALGN